MFRRFSFLVVALLGLLALPLLALPQVVGQGGDVLVSATVPGPLEPAFIAKKPGGGTWNPLRVERNPSLATAYAPRLSLSPAKYFNRPSRVIKTSTNIPLKLRI
jgi:hypothetical protein